MSITTILLLTLFLTLSFFSKAKKAVEEQGAPKRRHPAVPGQGGDDDESFEEDESPYFTYESDAEEIARTHRAPKAQRQAPVAAMASVADEPLARPQFDLRQAVISQVILTNTYIDEINQHNQ
ncbi:MAG: hypothetical protein J6X59_07795 [Bacteroidales bacterium]|nr:hypothetical protein [Bacteroidales bacterium]